MLTSSFGTNYVSKEHEHVDQYDSYTNTIQDKAMLKLSWKFQESKWNPHWHIVLTS